MHFMHLISSQNRRTAFSVRKQADHLNPSPCTENWKVQYNLMQIHAPLIFFNLHVTLLSWPTDVLRDGKKPTEEEEEEQNSRA